MARTPSGGPMTRPSITAVPAYRLVRQFVTYRIARDDEQAVMPACRENSADHGGLKNAP
jgi:hypothetical protein